MKSQQRLLLAYGSSTNPIDWREFCYRNGFEQCADGIRRVEVAYLPDRRLAFTRESRRRNGGVLDIVPHVGDAVSGVLFDVEPGMWDALDKKEGAPEAVR